MDGFVFVPTTQQNSGLLGLFNRGRQALGFASGDTVTATLVSRENGKASLHMESGFKFSVPSESVKGNVGDTLQFKVINQDKSGLALRQILPEGFEEAMKAAIIRGNAGIEDVGQVSKNLEQKTEDMEYRTKYQKEQQAKAAQAIAQVRRSQRMMSENSSRAAVSAIVASGIDLNKINFQTLSSIMKEIDTLPQPLEESLPDNDPKISEKIKDMLSEGLNDSAVAQLLKSGKDITPKQVYASRYAASSELFDKPADLSGWENLEEQISKLFERYGIENNERNMDTAKFLAAFDLPINKQNIEAAILLRNLNLLPSEMLEASVSEALAKGEDPSQIKLLPLVSSIDMTDILEVVKQVSSISSDSVATVIYNDQHLNLKNLIETEVKAEPAPVLQQEQEIVSYERSLRQLVEVQWKMTAQAAIRLANKGIAIDTTHLQELVEHLRNLENEGHAKTLKASGVEASSQNISSMENIFRVVRELKPAIANINANIQFKVFSQQIDFNLKGLEQARLAYEDSATLPSARHGDYFAKVEGQFGELLQKLQIEPTAANIRAATILSRNEVDLSIEAINEIKLIDSKLSATMDRLHPTIAAQMLKDGLVPMEMHIDDVLNYVRKFEKDRGYGNSDKVAQYIYQMDKAGGLSSEERSEMVAVYRMLNLIQKNGAAALGLAAKQDVNLTLGNLMEAAKFYDKNKNISATHVGSSSRLSSSLAYTDLLADSLADKGSPSILKEWLASDSDVSKALEDVLQQAKEGFKPDIDQATAAMKQLTDAPPALIAMLASSGINPTPNNIKAARKMSENENALADALNEIVEDMEIAASELGESFDLLSKPSQSYDSKEVLERVLDEIEGIPLSSVQRDARDLLQFALSRGDEDIPVLINGRFSALKLYTVNEDAVADGTARTFLSLATQALGNVQSYFTFADGRVNLQFAVDNPATRMRMEGAQEYLSELLQGIGYELGELSFTYVQTTVDDLDKGALTFPSHETLAEPEEDVYVPDTSDYEFTV